MLEKEFDSKKCQGRVLGSGGWHSYQCGNKPKVERDGKLYCGVHDPIRLQKKREEKQKEWKEEYRKKEAIWDRRRIMEKYFEGVSTEEIENMIKKREEK